MDAVRWKSGFIFVLTPGTCALVWALATPGCGGIVSNSRGTGSNDGDGGLEGSAPVAPVVPVAKPSDPSSACYANGGVPDPSNPGNCKYGSEATKICTTHYVDSRPTMPEPLGLANCASGCGCTSCAPQYDTCLANSEFAYSCMRVLDCIERKHCGNMVDCDQPTTCKTVMDEYGRDPPEIAAKIANIFSCMQQAGCSMSCTANPPSGR